MSGELELNPDLNNEKELMEASQELSRMSYAIENDAVSIRVMWFRCMFQKGDWYISRHTHSTYELHLIAKGRCRVVLDDGEFEAASGSLYITRPGEYHIQEGLDACPFFLEYSLNFDLTVLNDKIGEWHLIKNLIDRADLTCYPDRSGAFSLFEQALNEACAKQAGYYNQLLRLIEMIIVASARNMPGSSKTDIVSPKKTSRNELLVQEISAYITDNIRDNITVTQLANHFALSEKQLGRIIRQVTFLSTKNFINEIRVHTAERLLLEQKYSIKEIAAALGFANEYYFSQFYKSKTGYTPNTYKKSSLY